MVVRAVHNQKKGVVTGIFEMNEKKVSVALEAYLENIALLENELGHVRTSDLAQKMNCRLPSVTNALKRLAKLGLISYKPYKPFYLTDKGKAAIKKLEKYHESLAEFLHNVLNFPEDFSQKEACKLEHVISPAILARISEFNTFVCNKPSFIKLKADFISKLDN